jgi:undecaprenyl-diphosphatase
MFAASGAVARRDELLPAEQRAFTTVNRLPAQPHRPIWLMMQAGSLGAVGVAALAAERSGRRPLALALGTAGTATWGGAKVVKRFFGRGRPPDHIDGCTVRGRPASGLGFPSGHAAVSMTLATIAAPELSKPARVAAFGTATITALGRIYVGAHLPADVVGGMGMGLVAGALTNAVRLSFSSRSR